METRRYGKAMTVVEVTVGSLADPDGLARQLKRLVATGGTYKDGRIELQGDHRERVRQELERLGLRVEAA